jgi:hypothetical protein
MKAGLSAAGYNGLRTVERVNIANGREVAFYEKQTLAPDR